ncbi:MAG: hypothetical protein JNG86_03585 [Verrucomicrobiaceae bacterium]|nr:hypothetical protein [Verrucomicrobiaceae bacterium]
MPRFLSSIVYCLFPLLGISCVSPESPAQRQARAAQLAADLRALSPRIAAQEAQKLATTSVERAHELNRQWQPAQLPWMNNFFVNTGLRQNGLCYQWREAMYPPLHQLHLRTFDLHLASARRATLREHNAIVVTARGQSFEDGIVLDAWRSGGILKWARIKGDHYPWKPLPWELTPVVLRPYIMPELTPPARPADTSPAGSAR